MWCTSGCRCTIRSKRPSGVIFSIKDPPLAWPSHGWRTRYRSPWVRPSWSRKRFGSTLSVKYPLGCNQFGVTLSVKEAHRGDLLDQWGPLGNPFYSAKYKRLLPCSRVLPWPSAPLVLWCPLGSGIFLSTQGSCNSASVQPMLKAHTTQGWNPLVLGIDHSVSAQ